ncbi:type II toxin-antitoxin system VapC family toxin [Jiella mangrovi]|uniref:Type II toxin-antitoxin system VapC family toxin n=1 Tax=Jiella mangrovi TaxID=2821407 RepID=A0ABS4BLX0_9HYPH|nr:type II toxin-antitoxin system VapC family toxin [Jiella mangrovi]MBP0617717.1 type II toxin-antitoxin system VapC family toxin [Jiella mangrovi]
MAVVVLDASAILAFIRNEKGADQVLPHIGNGVVSAVNLQEVVKELALVGMTGDEIHEILDDLRLDVRGHDEAAAYASGMLAPRTTQYGRGLGDRSCMALGLSLGATVLTADREWKKVKINGLKLEHIR